MHHDPTEPTALHKSCQAQSCSGTRKHFFWLPAARVRVPGGSPFSQLQQREKDNSRAWKATACPIRCLWGLFFQWTYAVLIITIVAVIVPSCHRYTKETKERWKASKTEPNKQSPPTNTKKATTNVQFFIFSAHAMRARGSDGHQNVLWSVNYSQVAREQVKCKKSDVFQMEKQKTPTHKSPGGVKGLPA